MTRIVICRHGNTFDRGDVITRVGARTDMPLSISGIDQAKCLADHFSPETSDFRFKQAYCSSLLRTYQTADFVLTSRHPVKELTILQFLTEIDYGIDENKPESEVIDRLGEEAISQWDNDAIPPYGWMVNPCEIISAWETFFSEHKSSTGDVLVVTSNGIARFALDAIDEIVTDAPRKLRTAAYGIVELKNGLSKVTAWDKRGLKAGL